MKDCPYMRVQEKGKERVQPNGLSEEAPRRQRFTALKSRKIGEYTSSDVSGA